MIIDPASSGEESDDEQAGPSVSLVADKILDSSMVNFSEVPISGQPPAVILTRIDQKCYQSDLQRFSQTFCQAKPKKIKIVTLESVKISYCNAAIFYFNTEQEAQQFYTKCDHKSRQGQLEEELFRDYKLGNPKINVHYFADFSLNSSIWAAIIVRNIPSNFNTEKITNYFNSQGEKVNHVENPKFIKKSYCTVIRYDNIEQAEKICKKLNGQYFPGQTRKLKVHIHPNCSGRIRSANSHHRIFIQIAQSKNNCKPENISATGNLINEYLARYNNKESHLQRLIHKNPQQISQNSNIAQKIQPLLVPSNSLLEQLIPSTRNSSEQTSCSDYIIEASDQKKRKNDQRTESSYQNQAKKKQKVTGYKVTEFPGMTITASQDKKKI